MQGGICGHFSCLQECLEGAVGSSVTVDMRLESALNGGELKCYCGHASLLPSHPFPPAAWGPGIVEQVLRLQCWGSSFENVSVGIAY